MSAVGMPVPSATELSDLYFLAHKLAKKIHLKNSTIFSNYALKKSNKNSPTRRLYPLSC